MGRTETSSLIHMRFPFPKGCHDCKGRALQSIVLRETNSIDEENAARAADGDKGRLPFMKALFHESVVALRYADKPEDVAIEPPCAELEGWPTRTTEYAMRCFHKLNAVPEAEEEMGKAEAVDPKTLKATKAG